MGEGYRAEVERLAERAARFDGLAERAGAIHRDLADRLAALGPCWGADQVGASFAAGHAAPAEATLGALGALPDKLGDVGARFTGTATGYAEGERENVLRIQATDR